MLLIYIFSVLLTRILELHTIDFSEPSSDLRNRVPQTIDLAIIILVHEDMATQLVAVIVISSDFNISCEQTDCISHIEDTK